MARPSSYGDWPSSNYESGAGHSSFIVPMIPSASSSGQPSPLLGSGPGPTSPFASLASPSSVGQMNLFGTSPSSTRGYRHGGTAEAGEYRHAPSPATSYASAHSNQTHDDGRGLGIGLNHDALYASAHGSMGPPTASGGAAHRGGARGLGRMPSLNQLTQSTNSSHGLSHSGTGNGLGRSLSISGLGSIASSSTGGPPLAATGSARRGSSTNRLSYSPNPPPLATGWSASSSDQSHGSQPYRASPNEAARGSPLAAQSGMMRRGLSYDAAAQAGTSYGATPSRQPAVVPPPPQTTYSRQSGGYASPMSGVVSTAAAATSNLGSLTSPTAGGLPPLSPSNQSFAEHDRARSYSPSHYAASASGHGHQPFVAPPSTNPASSVYGTPAASFYAHHIPATSLSSQAAAIAPPPLSSTYSGSSQAPPPPSLTPSHQPQAQQYYQSQQYYDTLKPSASGSQPTNAAAFYAGGQVPAPPVRTPSAMAGAVGAGSGSRGFKKVTNTSDIRKVVNAQPVGRRADPAGGFVSPIKALTIALPQTYHLVNPAFKYETSLNPRRVLTKPSKPAGNEGYDNEDSDYILYVNDLLGPADKERYLILDVLGQGTFGQVVKCQNLVTHEIVAVKVVKNKPAYFQQSMMEVTILELINNQWDKDDEHHMLRLKDTFIHHSHLCLVFELLSNNLYELIKQNSFRGLSTSLVRVFTAQLLDAMSVLHDARIIHCDLKPENILLKSLQSPSIKMIDFGSACHEKQCVYSYVQSRFYRSPEVILLLPYSTPIDIWSLGCICVELFLGLPIFPGTSEFNQITRIVEMLGMPPDHMLDKGKQTSHFFEQVQPEFGQRRWRLKSLERYSAEFKVQEQPSKKYFQATTLPEIIKTYPVQRKLKEAEVEKEMLNRTAFIDFVQGLLNLDPERRWTPQQAKLHPFVLGEPLTKPFVPPPHLKPGSISQSAAPKSPQVDRPYGGLPPAPQRSTTRTYQDAQAYSNHLTQQQNYNAQAAAAAQRAAQVPKNPYMLPDVNQPLNQPYANAQSQRQPVIQPQQQLAPQQQQQMQAAAYGFSSGYSAQPRAPAMVSNPPPPGPTVANPPPVHHYTTRGRSNTAGQQDLPPQLQKLGHDLMGNVGAGQSITPVLRRDDQRAAWEREQADRQAGVQRRISISRNPHLNLLQDIADTSQSGHPWQSPIRAKPPPIGGPVGYSSANYYSPQIGAGGGSQQAFSVIVNDQRANAGQPTQDLFGSIAPPPQAYDGGAQRYAQFGGGGPPPQGFDAFGGAPNEGQGAMVGMYAPMQPFNAQRAQQGQGQGQGQKQWRQ